MEIIPSVVCVAYNEIISMTNDLSDVHKNIATVCEDITTCNKKLFDSMDGHVRQIGTDVVLEVEKNLSASEEILNMLSTILGNYAKTISNADDKAILKIGGV